RPPRGLDLARWRGDDSLAIEPDCASWDCAVSRGAWDFFQLERRGKPAPAAQGQGWRPESRADLHAVPESEGTALQPGHQALRRRAADAGHRAHTAHRRAAAAPR